MCLSGGLAFCPFLLGWGWPSRPRYQVGPCRRAGTGATAREAQLGGGNGQRAQLSGAGNRSGFPTLGYVISATPRDIRLYKALICKGYMNIIGITVILDELEAGTITWEQALQQVTSLPKVWQTAEWKERRAALIQTTCAVCATAKGPFCLAAPDPDAHV